MDKQRLIQVTGGINFRELGGYATVDNQHVRWHKLVRSANLADLTTADQQALGAYGVTTDIDFRSKAETEKQPDRLPAGATYHFVPVFDDDATESTRDEAGLKATFATKAQAGYHHMIKVYEDMVRLPKSQQAYRQFFDYLLANEGHDQSVLFHCTAGKDRTGMGAILALSALGVDPQVIKADYLLTNQTAAPVIERMVAVAAKDSDSAVLPDNVRALASVNPDYYDAAMRLINTQYGGMPDYLHEVLKISATELKDLKRLYLAAE